MTQQWQPINGGLPPAVNGPAEGPANDGPQQQAADRRRRPSALPEATKLGAVSAVVVGALVAAGLGTALHAQLLYVGETALPVGAVAALAFSGSTALFAGMWAGRAWVTALTGVLTYLLVGFFATARRSSILIITGDTRGLDLASATAGNIWIFGIAVVTVGAVLIAVRVLHPRRRKGRRRS
jgi:hypothetical protein